MAPHKDAHQDDYYAKVEKSSTEEQDAKKPLKLKIKPVIKKSVDTSINTPQTKDDGGALIANEKIEEKPKARLVEREHASE